MLRKEDQDRQDHIKQQYQRKPSLEDTAPTVFCANSRSDGHFIWEGHKTHLAPVTQPAGWNPEEAAQKLPEFSRPLSRDERETYQHELRRRQLSHIQEIERRKEQAKRENTWKPCLHDTCPDCIGTGVKATGEKCIHMISCDCSRCRVSIAAAHAVATT